MEDLRVTCDTIDALALGQEGDDLSPVERAAVDAHLRSCPGCRRRIGEARRLDLRLRDDAAEQHAPARLWARVIGRIEVEEVSPRRSTRRRFVVGAAAAAVILLLALTLAGPLDWRGDEATPVVVAESTNDFITYRLSERGPDVRGPDYRAVAGWLASRVEFSLPRDLAAPAGYRLAGARLCSFLKQRLVSYMFEKGGVAAYLYVMAEGDRAVLGTAWDATAEGFVSYRAQGLTILVWRESGLIFALVSDLSEDDLAAFRRDMSAGAKRPDDGRPPEPVILRASRPAAGVVAAT